MTREPLDLGAIVGRSFADLTAHPVLVLFALIPSAISVAAAVAVEGVSALDPSLVFDAGAPVSDPGLVAIIILVAIQLGSAALLLAGVTTGGLDAQRNGETHFGRVIGGAIALVLPALMVSIIAMVASLAGAILLIVPGLYVAGVWFVAVPALTERIGPFAALSRSAALTEGYRWPMVWLVVLWILLWLVITIAGAAVQYLAINLPVIGIAASAAALIATTAVASSFSALTGVHAFTQLQRVKEGGDDLADIFA